MAVALMPVHKCWRMENFIWREKQIFHSTDDLVQLPGQKDKKRLIIIWMVRFVSFSFSCSCHYSRLFAFIQGFRKRLSNTMIHFFWYYRIQTVIKTHLKAINPFNTWYVFAMYIVLSLLPEHSRKIIVNYFVDCKLCLDETLLKNVCVCVCVTLSLFDWAL